MEKNYHHIIALELGLNNQQVSNTLLLLAQGATIPFIARYRKERTQSLDEMEITKIRDRHNQLKELDKRRVAILESIEEQGKLTDELKIQIEAAETMAVLEDLYLPYRPKRKTRASVAMAKGLEPLAIVLFRQERLDVELEAEKYLTDEVTNIEEALQGARDIMAEWINEDLKARKQIRKLYHDEALITSLISKGKEIEGQKYQSYFECTEPLMKAPSHRILAMFRGENEGFLKLKIYPDEKKALDILVKLFIKNNSEAAGQVSIALQDSYKRLLAPSLENEYRNLAKEQADEKAIQVFAENLRQLILASPLGQKRILAIDPGYRTGCKLVCLDEQGNLLHNETIYPHQPQMETKQAISKIQSLVKAYKIEAIAIGNGTAGRETERMIKHIKFDQNIIAIMVNESGASVYSASAIAREEFPEYDVTVRGAVSIGRRLMDPMAELVKIDPKSIGVGQYQHDVNQTDLNSKLGEIVESCVNSVGVELNTASKHLLSYVSGLGSVLAQNIIDYRKTNGFFKSREELKKVERFGSKAFEQSAGFLRIRDAVNPLDKSAVHPESYGVVKKMADKIGCSVDELIGNKNKVDQLKLEDFVTDNVGLPTLKDIVEELAKPGRDPRQKFDFFEFAEGIHDIKDLQEGMRLPGIITNITAFGAFVDIGVHQDGLVHISKLADQFVKDPNEVVTLNQKVEVRVMSVDIPRKRIQLSMID